jgi:acetyl-CoA carboxylase biotin carboxyl carrier protein
VQRQKQILRFAQDDNKGAQDDRLSVWDDKRVGEYEVSMKSDDIEQLKELVAFLKEQDIAEFDLDRGDLKVRLKFASSVVASTAAAQQLDLASLARLMGSASVAGAGHMAAGHAAPGPVAIAAQAAAEPEEELHIIKSPIVGTFYESPSPGSSAFVSSGDRIEKGQVVCIVEAMKLMNEIESDAAGEVVKRLVQNGQPVEYGQALFAVRPR